MLQSNDIQDFRERLKNSEYNYIEIYPEIYPESEETFSIDCFGSKYKGRAPITRYRFQKRQRVVVKMLAERYGVEYETLPMFDDKTSVQKEFEGWLAKIEAKNIDDKIDSYERAVIFAKELAYGTTRAYWKNEIGSFDRLRLLSTDQDFIDVRIIGRRRLLKYMEHRITYGERYFQTYTTRRGHLVQGVENETDDMNLMLDIMAGTGLLEKVTVSNGENVYKLTSEAFALLKEPKWHERHAELLSWLTVTATILSIVLMLRELGVV